MVKRSDAGDANQRMIEWLPGSAWSKATLSVERWNSLIGNPNVKHSNNQRFHSEQMCCCTALQDMYVYQPCFLWQLGNKAVQLVSFRLVLKSEIVRTLLWVFSQNSNMIGHVSQWDLVQSHSISSCPLNCNTSNVVHQYLTAIIRTSKQTNYISNQHCLTALLKKTPAHKLAGPLEYKNEVDAKGFFKCFSMWCWVNKYQTSKILQDFNNL